ncbi:MAG: ThuA domain-containing protein [Armatimonadetes bacterium]|nr:ThuA domain-containing protein [Armatimonadota bacterium]MDW8122140.1 ThuA domain-containing protein [Armatimonadota bacterium]
MANIKITVWSEFTEPRSVYPNGIHGAVADYLKRDSRLEVRTSQLSDPEQGLSTDLLQQTDVLVWWGHAKHGEVANERVHRIVEQVRERGMGFVALHSAHYSKPFQAILDCPGHLGGWREAGEVERIWIVQPDHPVAKGLPNPIVIESEEMYSEPFVVPPPEELVMISWFAGGEVFRSACCWHSGKGRVFYFRPGHETYRTFYHPEVLKVIANGVLWAARVIG